MQTVIIVVHLIIVLALVAVVLLQRSEGGGLGLGGGGGGVSGFMTGRGQANALTKTTAILAGLFFLTSIVLAAMATYQRAPSSILDQAPPPASAPAGDQTPTPGGGGTFLDQLRRQQGDQPAPSPTPPAAPAPSPQ